MQATPGYTRALEGSISKTFVIDTNQTKKKSLIKNTLKVENWKYPDITISTNFVSTKFSDNQTIKESGTRTHGNPGIFQENLMQFNIQLVTPRASISNLTNYSSKK